MIFGKILENHYLTLVYRCGSGLSGECLTEQGHNWIGVDISSHMLGEL